MPKEFIAVMIDPEVRAEIDKRRGKEPRSSFIRGIIIKWYNRIRKPGRTKEE